METATIPVSYDELSVLALDAAIELERLLGGQEADMALIGRLVDTLEGSGSLAKHDTSISFLADPRAADIYGRALVGAGAPTVNTVDQLSASVQTYVRAFKERREDPRDKLAGLKSFCLSLHRILVAEGMPQYDDPSGGLVYGAFAY